MLSGVNPSSKKGVHIGNYFGAIKQHIEFQSKGQAYYFIADYHALNTVTNPKEFHDNIIETYIEYMSFGVDFATTVFFVESHVRQIFELSEILSNVVDIAQMKRMHAYKDKLSDPNIDPDSICMGLFNYPILMAADILVFEPDVVPVAEDQVQHVEICRDMARSFNQRYGKVLKIPDLYVKPETGRILGIDGERKMSKSLGNDLPIFAEEKMIHDQIMRVTTDPGRIHPTDPGDPAKNVIFSYLDMMSYDKTKLEEYKERYRKGTVGDMEIKKEFYDYFMRYFADFRAKRNEISSHMDDALELMKENGTKASLIAEKTMSKVRDSIGAVSV